MSDQPSTRRGRTSDLGFTIIEIVIAIVIVGILASVAVVAVDRARESAQRSACSADLDAVGLALKGWIVGHPGRTDATETELVGLGLLEAESDLHDVGDANTITPVGPCLGETPASSTSTTTGHPVSVPSTTIPTTVAATTMPTTTVAAAATTTTTIVQPSTWQVVQGQPPTIANSSVAYSSSGSVINRTPAAPDGTIGVTAAVTVGSGYGVWFRTTVVAGALISGYTLQWDLGYRTGPDAAPNLVLRKWGIAPGGAFGECAIPVANIPIPADLRNADPHRITIRLDGVLFVAGVDGREVLRVDNLTTAANKVCTTKPLPDGTLFGYRVWSGPAAVTFTSPSLS